MKKGLYVHIPFCNHICGYCDFVRGPYQKELASKYLGELKKEILAKDLNDIDTIYIGGGTPSALNTSQLRFLFEMLEPYCQNISEYTIEVNPESLTKAKAELFSEYKISRVSMGMQVTQSHLLNLIDRKHDLDDVKKAISILKDVDINNISVDLMYGIPTQTLAELETSIEKIAALDITHVSLYALTIEPNSKFKKRGYKEAAADLDADMYETALEYLEQHGFYRYEISNFAKESSQSKHNKIYWKYQDFVGVGLNASGKENHQRYTNTRNLEAYLNGKRKEDVINLSKNDEIFEYIMMNLRMSEGFKLSDFKKRFNVDFRETYKVQLKELINDKLVIIENNTVRASSYGLEILHNVIEKFMDVI